MVWNRYFWKQCVYKHLRVNVRNIFYQQQDFIYRYLAKQFLAELLMWGACDEKNHSCHLYITNMCVGRGIINNLSDGVLYDIGRHGQYNRWNLSNGILRRKYGGIVPGGQFCGRVLYVCACWNLFYRWHRYVWIYRRVYDEQLKIPQTGDFLLTTTGYVTNDFWNRNIFV